jgi:hypothetical protein
MKNILKVLHTIVSIAGFVPENMTILRCIFMFGSVYATMFYLPQFASINLSVAYFLFSTVVYLGFIFAVLPQNGLRLKMIEKFGEEKAYLYFEGFLAFAFFHNGFGLNFISESSINSGFWGEIPRWILIAIAGGMFIFGFVIKIWSAHVVGIPIYYWKDMFLGRKICDFVVTGPYKYFSNPMYGLGQLQVYAIAIYHNSIYGLFFAAVNQLLVFFFYYTAEKAFIKRTYIDNAE